MNKRLLLLLTLSSPLGAISSEQAYYQLAQTLRSENNIDEAIIEYKNTLNKNPKHQEALLELGQLLYNQKNYSHAAAYFEQLHAFAPQHFEALIYAGRCHDALNDYTKAVHFFNAALKLNPSSPVTYTSLAHIYKKKSDIKSAINILYTLLELKPQDIDSLNLLAALLKENHQLAQAIEIHDKILHLNPQNNSSIFEKANIYLTRGMTQEASALYNQLLEKSPESPSLLFNTSFVLKKENKFAEALALLKKVCNLQPDNTNARQSMAYTQLTLGDFEQGFKEFAQSNTPQSARLLKNIESINGKIILVTATWCLEDMVQFVRYTKLIKKHGGKVVVQTNIPLVPLFKLIPEIDTVVTLGQNPPPFHFMIPMTNLPNLFNTTQSTVPCELPYMHADPELEKFWHDRIGNKDAIKIGVYWHQADEHCDNAAEYKNFPLQELAHLAQQKNIHLYNLHGLETEQIKNLPYECLIHNFGKGFDLNDPSLSHLAAILKNLDAVITRDSLLAHIASALNCPVFVALPHQTDWRWMLERNDSPWYPNIKLFRQKTAGQWHDVCENIVKDVETFISSKK